MNYRHWTLKFTLIVADLIGLNYLFRAINANKVRILMYHGISPVKLPDVYWLHIDVEDFRHQMNYLKTLYNVEPVTVLIDQTDNTTSPSRNSVVISFDDGLKNVYTTAKPVLEELCFPAVFFVVPDLSERNEKIWSSAFFELILKTPSSNIDLTPYGLERYHLDENIEHRTTVAEKIIRDLKALPKHSLESIISHINSHYGQELSLDDSPFWLMTDEQIKLLSESTKFDIGPHTNNHMVLSSLTSQQQRTEIIQSLDKLNEWGIQSVPVFCYPSGRFNNDTVSLLKEAGIKAAVGTEDGLHDLSDDNYNIKRISVGPGTSLWEFKARLSGFFYFLMRLIGHG
jgi:peptidoglycan/xylan/chitin deacetylase (PgdA/CDA1 family)